MEYVIGLILATVAGVALTLLRMDRDRSLYPAILIVIALLYELFAVMGGSTTALIAETIAGLVFISLAVGGFKSSLWLVVIGLIGHGVFDFVHAWIIQNPGVPVWWPGFCGTYDVAAGIYLCVLVSRNRIRGQGAI